MWGRGGVGFACVFAGAAARRRAFSEHELKGVDKAQRLDAARGVELERREVGKVLALFT